MKQALNTSRASILAAALAATTALGVAACSEGSTEPQCNATLPTQHSKLVWPGAPQKARIAYVGVLQENSGCDTGTDVAPLALDYPKAIGVGQDNVVYVSDRYGVRRFNTATGDIRPFAEDVLNARGLAVTDDGRVFVVDNEQPRVAVYSADNQLVAEMGAGDLVNPQGIALDAARNRLYVADAARDAVLSYSLDGQFLASIESTAQQAIGVPTQVAVNSQGEVYVVHQGWPKVLRFDAAGASLGGFGDDGTFPGQFVRPKGIAIDSEDHVYVSDAAFDNFQIFDKDGTLLLFVGQAGSGAGEFNLPFMMTVDQNDRIYVAEFGNHRVQVLQYLGNQN